MAKTKREDVLTIEDIERMQRRDVRVGDPNATTVTVHVGTAAYDIAAPNTNIAEASDDQIDTAANAVRTLLRELKRRAIEANA